LHVVSVFLGPDETGGNPLGVFVEAGDTAPERRQEIAADLGYSETVFVTGADATLAIHTPTRELPLAGHPLVGTAWLLRGLGRPTDTLRPPAGPVPTWAAGDTTWIRADPADAPDFTLRRLATPAEVDAYAATDGGENTLDIWSWLDEDAGRVRCRVFPRDMGIVEDEATGAAALRLTAALGRPLDIRQGVGSQILSSPTAEGLVEIGGRCRLLDTREY